MAKIVAWACHSVSNRSFRGQKCRSHSR